MIILHILLKKSKIIAVVGEEGKQHMQEMNVFTYEVADIDGDYAHLKRTDIAGEEEKLVARALLPPEITEGTKLKYEWMQYEIIDG